MKVAVVLVVLLFLHFGLSDERVQHLKKGRRIVNLNIHGGSGDAIVANSSNVTTNNHQAKSDKLLLDPRLRTELSQHALQYAWVGLTSKSTCFNLTNVGVVLDSIYRCKAERLLKDSDCTSLKERFEIADKVRTLVEGAIYPPYGPTKYGNAAAQLAKVQEASIGSRPLSEGNAQWIERLFPLEQTSEGATANLRPALTGLQLDAGGIHGSELLVGRVGSVFNPDDWAGWREVRMIAGQSILLHNDVRGAPYAELVETAIPQLSRHSWNLAAPQVSSNASALMPPWVPWVDSGVGLTHEDCLHNSSYDDLASYECIRAKKGLSGSLAYEIGARGPRLKSDAFSVSTAGSTLVMDLARRRQDHCEGVYGVAASTAKCEEDQDTEAFSPDKPLAGSWYEPLISFRLDFEFAKDNNGGKMYADVPVPSSVSEVDLRSMMFHTLNTTVTIDAVPAFPDLLLNSTTQIVTLSDLVFEYAIKWDTDRSYSGVEFELNTGFRLRDHGTHDLCNFSAHSEKNFKLGNSTQHTFASSEDGMDSGAHAWCKNGTVVTSDDRPFAINTHWYHRRWSFGDMVLDRNDGSEGTMAAMQEASAIHSIWNNEAGKSTSNGESVGERNIMVRLEAPKPEEQLRLASEDTQDAAEPSSQRSYTRVRRFPSRYPSPIMLKNIVASAYEPLLDKSNVEAWLKSPRVLEKCDEGFTADPLRHPLMKAALAQQSINEPRFVVSHHLLYVRLVQEITTLTVITNTTTKVTGSSPAVSNYVSSSRELVNPTKRRKAIFTFLDGTKETTCRVSKAVASHYSCCPTEAVLCENATTKSLINGSMGARSATGAPVVVGPHATQAYSLLGAKFPGSVHISCDANVRASPTSLDMCLVPGTETLLELFHRLYMPQIRQHHLFTAILRDATSFCSHNRVPCAGQPWLDRAAGLWPQAQVPYLEASVYHNERNNAIPTLGVRLWAMFTQQGRGFDELTLQLQLQPNNKLLPISSLMRAALGIRVASAVSTHPPSPSASYGVPHGVGSGFPLFEAVATPLSRNSLTNYRSLLRKSIPRTRLGIHVASLWQLLCDVGTVMSVRGVSRWEERLAATLEIALIWIGTVDLEVWGACVCGQAEMVARPHGGLSTLRVWLEAARRVRGPGASAVISLCEGVSNSSQTQISPCDLYASFRGGGFDVDRLVWSSGDAKHSPSEITTLDTIFQSPLKFGHHQKSWAQELGSFLLKTTVFNGAIVDTVKHPA